MRHLRNDLPILPQDRKVLFPRLLLYGQQREGAGMKPLETRIFEYQLSMAAFRTLLRRGIVTEEEFVKISEIIAKNHGLSLCSIFLEKR